MPWKARDVMSLRREFAELAGQEGANVSALCRRYGISRAIAYKWLSRYGTEGAEGLADRSRRPHHSPRQTTAAVAQRILALRAQHPAWGARKLHRRLADQGWTDLPSVGAVHAVLVRAGCIRPEQSAQHRAWERFEHPHPNDLWQMDFKGHFALDCGARCQPLTVLDDHSRFNLLLQACPNQQASTVETALISAFRRYGLPRRMTMDNGAPWGDDAQTPYTRFTVWLLRLGIQVSHSRPYHPQTQGKDERFHRTLKAELLAQGQWQDWPTTQRRFDAWRDTYNLLRPHQALRMNTPASCYQISSRPYPESLPPLQYGPDDHPRKVDKDGYLSFRGRTFRLGKAFIGQTLGLRPTTTDGLYDAFLGTIKINSLDLRLPR
jgi:transposase InsO family protein